MSVSDPLIGAHMSIAGGTPLAVQRALQAGCRVLQIFVKNSNRWKGKTLDDEEVAGFRKVWADSKLHQVVAHDSYLINLASPQKELWQRSIEAMLDELDRCQRLGAATRYTRRRRSSTKPSHARNTIAGFCTRRPAPGTRRMSQSCRCAAASSCRGARKSSSKEQFQVPGFKEAGSEP